MARVRTSMCPTCARLYGEKHKATMKTPSVKTMERWVESGAAEATDGCQVEPDGSCGHGHMSWLLRLDII